jgi:hypothetical protein
MLTIFTFLVRLLGESSQRKLYKNIFKVSPIAFGLHLMSSKEASWKSGIWLLHLSLMTGDASLVLVQIIQKSTIASTHLVIITENFVKCKTFGY